MKAALKSQKLYLHVTPALARAVAERARADGRTVSNWLERLVARAVGQADGKSGELGKGGERWAG
jgi:hypothetical protein